MNRDHSINKSSVLDLLRDHGVLTTANVAMLRDFIERWSVSGFEAILQTNVLDEDQLANSLAEVLQIGRYYHLDEAIVNSRARSLLSYATAKQLSVLPIAFDGEAEDCLRLVMADPTDELAILQVSRETQKKVDRGVAAYSDIQNAIHRFYPAMDQLSKLWGGRS